MSNIFNAAKGKMKSLKSLRFILIMLLLLALITSVTLAWYIHKTSVKGMEFSTGNVKFNTYIYDGNGEWKAGPISSDDENGENAENGEGEPLITIKNAHVGTHAVAYIAVESYGSLGMDYRLSFGFTGLTEDGLEYLGAYRYNITKDPEGVIFNGGHENLTGVPSEIPEGLVVEKPLITIDKNAVNGRIELNQEKSYHIYRVDILLYNDYYYEGRGINIYFNVAATQIGGNYDNEEVGGAIRPCSSIQDLERAAVEAYPGDTIRLTNSIDYYGDLVFNKPINIETNNFTLTVVGNLIYDYSLGNSLKLDAGGKGRIVVTTSNVGAGGNFQIKAPISMVSLIGSNDPNGDIVVDKSVIIDATNTYGSPGVSFNEVKIVGHKNAPKMIQLESNTRATVSFGTTIDTFKSVDKAKNIEIVNNGEIREIILSNMAEVKPQPNSPQIFITNNNRIISPIALPEWSKKFVETEDGCEGNTRIIQSLSGDEVHVSGSATFTDKDVESEIKESLIGQIEEGNDSRLRIYYQDDKETNKVRTIEEILENYFQTEAAPGYTIRTVVELEIICVGDKQLTKADIDYMNSDKMYSLAQLDMQRANVQDNKLYNNAFTGISKYEELILPQNLTAIGDGAFQNSEINNIITVPSGVTEFGKNWFYNGQYVRFAATSPDVRAIENNRMQGVKAIFVDEAYIGEYKTSFNAYATRIYPTSVMDKDGLYFVRNIKDDEWEITYYIGREDSASQEAIAIGENITIDSTILKITSVYDNAYRHNFTGTEVKFADSVENLGAYNFYANKKITSANLNKLKNVGESAFYNTPALASVNFGVQLETIGANAFYSCESLNQSVLLPDTMQKIGAAAFRETNITSVNTGGTQFVDGSAFYGCAQLIYAEWPNVREIGSSVFYTCESLVSVKMPALVKASGSNMFTGCISLRELYMMANDDDISLGTSVFGRCDLTKIKLYVPEEHLAFYQSKRPGGIEAQMIYPQGEKMGTQLVKGFNIGNYIVSERGDNTYTLITSNLDYVDSLKVPETFNEKKITHIYTNAFRNQSMTNVTLTLGNNIRSIGSYAFYGLGGLVAVEFGSALESIDSYAFSKCANLKQDILLPGSMEKIGHNAFRESGILRFNSGGTTEVENSAFAYCSSLAKVELPEVATITGNGVFAGCITLVSVDIPKLSKISAANTFSSCNALHEIYLGSNEATITLGSNPFAGVDSSIVARIKLFVPEELVSFYKGRNIVAANRVYPRGEKIGDKAVNDVVIGDYVVLENDDGYTLVTSNLEFEGDEPVPNLYKGKPITEVYPNAFRNQKFTEANLIFGDNLKTIGDEAFNAVSGLKSVIMDQVTTIGANAFKGSSIEVMNAPKLTSVGTGAFMACKNLETVNIPNIVTIESTNVFAECTNLKSVYFESVMSVEKSTFSKDVNLEKITINRKIGAGGTLPAEMTIEDAAPCKIYVPYSSVTAYTSVSSTKLWSNKPVVSFDISATYNGDTYILSNNNGRYTLISFEPSQTPTNLTMPATVLAPEIGEVSIYSIESGAFSKVANSMTSLTLSGAVAQLSGMALSECVALENIYVVSDNAYFTSVGGVLYSKDAKMLVKYPAGRADRFDMTATDYASTIGIGANAFANAKLTEIVFPASLVMIDSTAFANCSNLKTVEFKGNTPPVLMGSGIFDTKVEDFKMIVPTADTAVLTTYLWAYNFVEYEPYIELPAGYEKPMQNTVSSIIAPEKVTDRERGEIIAAFAQELVGSPYVYGGTSPDGFDCSGFVQYVYRENGIIINRMADEQADDGYSVSYGDMLPGDLVYFGDGTEVTHVGIYLGDGQFAHAQNSVAGVVITSMFDSYYANRFMYARRIIG